MKSWREIAFGILLGLLAAAGVRLVSQPPRGAAVQLLPPPTALPLVVHVSGGVASPGVYQLPPGSRLHEAIIAAGGLLPQANAEALNLAAFLQDGQLVNVPLLSISPTPIPPTAGALRSNPAAPLPAPQASPPAPGSPAGLVDINHASTAELESLPGIGPALADRIIAHREAHGPFPNIEAIQDVSGIGPVTFERLKDLITARP